MPRRGEGLQLRGATWWLRIRVPDDVRSAFGKREVHKSLKTGSHAQARQRARLERLKLDAEWHRIRRFQDPTPVAELGEDEIHYLAINWFVGEERKQQSAVLGPEGLHEAEVDLTHIATWDEIGSSVTVAVDALLSAEGIKLEREAQSRRILERHIHAAMIESQKRLLQRHQAGLQLSLDPQFAGITAATKVTPVAKTTLAGLIERYDTDRTRRPVSPKTRLKWDAQFRVFKEVFGAKARIADIGRAEVRNFVDMLTRLPDNATKRFPGMPLVQVAAIATEQGLRPMSITTANSYITALSTLFRYAVNEQEISSNPADGLRLQRDTVRAKDKRLPFSASDLRRIFHAPLYTGCRDDSAGYATPGPKRPRRGRFWIPLIALFTGMRLNEICQLIVDDITVEDGTDVILVRGDDDDETKRIKTAAGERFVPVHPELTKIGLLDYVASQQTSDHKARLFPELSIASTGYMSDNFSKWFARFLDKAEITDKRKVFHSFRHTYRDALREADISIEKVRALGGWSSGRTEDDYGRGLRPSTLARDIEQIRYYPDLDLGHLYQSPATSKGAT